MLEFMLKIDGRFAAQMAETGRDKLRNQQASRDDDEVMPLAVRLLLLGVVLPLCLGALYLVAVRRHALFLDLSLSPASLWCF